jgi:hypothetical protein
VGGEVSARERLSAIEARAAAATAGPWWIYLGGGGWHVNSHDEHGRYGITVASLLTDDRDADAIFIANARQDVPTLVAALRAVLDRDALAELLSRTRHPIRWEYRASSTIQDEDYEQADAVIALIAAHLDTP